MNVAIIFGRKNSKGLKNKNITKFLENLLVYTLLLLPRNQKN